MIIIRNNIIPFPGYKAINICGILFARKNAVLSDIDINHEEIHTKQMIELLFLFFYIIYGLEWLFKVLFVYPFSHKAYRNVSFEKEAYANENNLDYIKTRKHYAMWRN